MAGLEAEAIDLAERLVAEQLEWLLKGHIERLREAGWKEEELRVLVTQAMETAATATLSLLSGTSKLQPEDAEGEKVKAVLHHHAAGGAVK
jgi:alkylhydroperoxidase/carboxymuconolactone decarboxylase family protein YurZ